MVGFCKVWPSPWPCGLLVLGPVVRGPVVSGPLVRESTFRVFVLYIGQSRCGDKGFTVSGVNPEDPKAQKLQYTPHMNPLRTRHDDLVFANGGGLRPPQPPRCLFKPCRLAFKNIAP